MPDEPERPLPVMPWWVVTVGLAGAALAGAAVIWWLLGEAAHGTPTRAGLRIDAIRTGLTVVAGTGGAVALLFAARRQWLAERAQRHREQIDAAESARANRVQDHEERLAAAERAYQDRVAAQAELDATERRITELFARAVDQLGAGTAAARLGGLFALERLAATHPAHRQTIVDMICGYLRMPSAADDPQEPQVRRTAQRILTRHLVPDTDAYWDGLVLDLSGAVLVDLDGAGCRFVAANLAGARCEGRTVFDGATFADFLRLSGAHFGGETSFAGATCAGPVHLAGARFGGETSFAGAVFAGPLDMAGTVFGAAVSFTDATFATDADLVFDPDAFGAAVSFRRARFGGTVRFDQVAFAGHAGFDHAEFSAGVSFDHARFGDGLRMRDATCDAIAYLRWLDVTGDASFSRTVFRQELTLHQSTFRGSVRFHQTSVGGTASFSKVRAAAGVGNAWPPGFTETPAGDGWVAVTPDEVSGSERGR